MTRKYSRIERYLWRDERFTTLSDEGKLLWLYFLSCPHSLSLPGLIPVSMMTIVSDLWISDPCVMDPESIAHGFQTLDRAISELEDRGWIEVDRPCSLVFLPRAVAHNRPASINVAVGWANALREVPRSHLVGRWIASADAVFRDLWGEDSSAYSKVSESISYGSQIHSAWIPDRRRIHEHEHEHENERERPTSEPAPPAPESDEHSSVFSADARRVASELESAIVSASPGWKKRGGERRWLLAADRMLRLDNRDVSRTIELIRWATAHDFWAQNIQSAEKLRKHWDRLDAQEKGERGKRTHSNRPKKPPERPLGARLGLLARDIRDRAPIASERLAGLLGESLRDGVKIGGDSTIGAFVARLGLSGRARARFGGDPYVLEAFDLVNDWGSQPADVLVAPSPDGEPCDEIKNAVMAKYNGGEG